MDGHAHRQVIKLRAGRVRWPTTLKRDGTTIGVVRNVTAS
jgi:hypothetical protein